MAGIIPRPGGLRNAGRMRFRGRGRTPRAGAAVRTGSTFFSPESGLHLPPDTHTISPPSPGSPGNFARSPPSACGEVASHARPRRKDSPGKGTEMAEPATSSLRNVALDNLRVVAMLLGLVTHGVLPYTATGV